MAGLGEKFRALHVPGEPFTLVNVWDRGSARIMQGLGAQALATTSAGHAFTLGRVDGGTLTRDEALAHAQDLVSAVDIPVSGDFENGFGGAPDIVAETIRLAASVGLAGCSIEDTDLPTFGAYDFDLAVERIRAGSAAARALSEDFFLLARADGVMLDSYDLDEAIRRIQAFADAGADGVYVPGLADWAALKRVTQSVSVPVNALTSGRFSQYSRKNYADIGVARISIGGAAARVAYEAAIEAGKRLVQGDYSALAAAIDEDELNSFFTDAGGMNA